jgi:uncharacterized protein YcbK (DUF882 family)
MKHRLGFAFVFALLGHGSASAEPVGQAPAAAPAASTPDETSVEKVTPAEPAENGGEDADTPAAAAESAAEAPPKVARPARKPKAVAKGKPVKATIEYHRKPRNGAKLMGALVPDELLRSSAPPRPSGNIHLFVLATREQLKVNIYNDDGSYNVDSLRAVSHVLRCKRTDAEKDMEPRLLTVLSIIYDHFGGKPLQVVSGYRNQRKVTSYHFKGSASDIRIPGVKPLKVRNFAETLDAGGMGIGLYPRAEFVHVDVRPPPSYRWIDYAKSDPDNPDKRPPKGWKRKKLQS